MRARSTEASVCPARTSTPPLRARRVWTCPGRARSSGRVLGSVVAKIVVARSEALVPVVVPRRASIGSQNGVPKAEVFRGVIAVRFNASQRCSVSARQIRPRPNLVMKLMASGVTFSAAMVRSPSFSRSSSSTRTIIRPARISSSASSTVTNGASRLVIADIPLLRLLDKFIIARDSSLFLRGRRCDVNVGANFVEARGRNAVNREQILHAVEAAAFFAHFYDGCGGRTPDAGDLLELRGRRCVQIDGRRRWQFFLRVRRNRR